MVEKKAALHASEVKSELEKIADRISTLRRCL